jgi:WD40 repeat protein
MPRLSVEGPYEYTDLRILDQQLTEVASGTHALAVDVPPGIYRVEAKVPGAREERLVTVPSEGDVHVVDFVLRFDSPAPVRKARTYRDGHADAARFFSHAIHAKVAGSSLGRLFLITRTDGSSREVSPVVDVTTRSGEVLARLDGDGFTDLREGLSALSVVLPAGTYMLAHSDGGLGRRGQVIFVEQGWQTQVYAPWDREGVGLSRSLVSMVPEDRGFEPESYALEYVEAALDGLARGRVVLTPSEESALLDAKFDNPMLGLIAAYAYLLRGQVDPRRFSVIARNLARLMPHSCDAQVLVLFASTLTQAPRLPFEFVEPPMFALGTELLIAQAAQDESLVPASSWLAQLSLTLTTGSVFTRVDLDADPARQLSAITESISVEQGDVAARMKRLARTAGLPLSVVKERLQSLWIWDPEASERRTILEGHRINALTGVTLAGRKLLASADSDGAVRIWDLETGDERLVLRGHLGGVSALTGVTLAGRELLASVGSDGTVRIWDLETGVQRTVLQTQPEWVNALCAVTVGGRELLASAGSDGTVRIWDLETAEQRLVLRGNQSGINALCAVSVGGRKLLASAGSDGTVRIWDLETAEQRLVLRGDPSGITALSVVTVGGRELLASAGSDGTVRIWDLDTVAQRTILQTQPEWVNALCAVMVGGRELLASAGSDGTVRIWDPETGIPSLTVPTNGIALAIQWIADSLIVGLNTGILVIKPSATI